MVWQRKAKITPLKRGPHEPARWSTVVPTYIGPMRLRANQGVTTPIDEAMALGRASFAQWFRAYMAQTTQYKLLKAMESYYEGGRLMHSSQVGGLQTQDIREPSPKLFLALGYFNLAHARSLGWPPERIDASAKLNLPRLLPESVRDIWEAMEPLSDTEGVAMGPAALFEAFSGLLELPVSVVRVIPAGSEAAASKAVGHFLRLTLPQRGVDWFATLPDLKQAVPCIEELLMDRPVKGKVLLAALPQLAHLADTTDDALWDLISLSLPS